MTKRQFQQTIWAYYKSHKRSFPWRTTKNPYFILVSEVMLQQTQTSRVVEKYRQWIHIFPTVRSLARAPLTNVLREWQGLGYNRRALNLKRACEKIMKEHAGIFPNRHEDILRLPGVGAYTAGAVMAFAFDTGFPIIETNIRTVFIHFFFKNAKNKVSDQKILALVKKTMPKERVADWYHALMDYGVYLKQSGNSLNQKSLSYRAQSPFKGSNRELRSLILRKIAARSQTKSRLLAEVGGKKRIQIEKNLRDLEKEGFIKKRKSLYMIA